MSLWIKQIDESLLALAERPLFHPHRPFPFEEIEKHLALLFDHSGLKLKKIASSWSDSPLEGFEKNARHFSIRFHPLKHPLFFAVTEHDLKQLMAILLGGEASFIEQDDLSGFYHYLGLEVLSFLDRLGYAKNLSPRFEETQLQNMGGCFVIDCSCKIENASLHGRVILPEEFRKEWKEHFASLPPQPLTKEEKEKIPIVVAFEIGQSKIPWNEWRHVKEGDFIILDQTSYDPTTKKGRLILSLGGKPIFRGKIRDEGIKLLEYPLYEETREMSGSFEEEEDIENFEEIVPEKKEEGLTPEKIEVMLTIEAGRVRLSVEELLELAPGSLIDLKIAPEQGVDLVLNGRRVGRGELIKMGDVLGVRVLQL